jgi:hypothetical protein
MKISFFILLVSISFINCSNSKKASKEMTQDIPLAEVSLAPNHIHVLLKITNIIQGETQKTISGVVEEVLNYGSAVEPVPSGSIIKFSMSNELPKDNQEKTKIGTTINAVLLSENQEMMMEGQTKSTLWKLISIND